MIKRLNRKWHRLRHARPGTRFLNYYRRSRRERNRDEVAPRIARLVLAMALFAVGVSLFFLPLVYIPFFLASAALLAAESLKLAHLLDRSESWVRASCERIRLRCGLSSKSVRVVAVTLGLVCLVFSGFVCFSVVLR